MNAGQTGGLLSREALSEALACSSLITVLVQTMGDAALQPLEPTLRYAVLAPPFDASGSQREGCCVIVHALLRFPEQCRSWELLCKELYVNHDTVTEYAWRAFSMS